MPSQKMIEQEVLKAKLPKGQSNMVLTVNPNEKAFMVIEKDLAPTDGSDPRRYQTIYVRRDGELASFIRDLGSANKDIGEFVIPLMWEYTVAEASDLALEYRERQTLAEKLEERAESSTLMEEFHTLQEVKQAVLDNKTVFGSGSSAPTSQRNYRIGDRK